MDAKQFGNDRQTFGHDRIGISHMKAKKKKMALPRRQWKINPVTRVKESAKKYSRPRVQREGLKYGE
jgi:hypothetical protein